MLLFYTFIVTFSLNQNKLDFVIKIYLKKIINIKKHENYLLFFYIN